jgi:uncharacterized protein YgiM (DUF1202 family)
MISNRIGLLVAILVVGMLVTGCQPISADNMASALAGQEVVLPTPVATEEAESAAGAAVANLGDGAVATVTASSLRVRAQPSTEAEVVAGVRQGEQFAVIGRSSDGLWLELAVPRATQGRGWVSSNFVTVSGSIVDAPVTSPSVEAAPTPAPTEEPTEEATEEAAEATPTAAPSEEAAEATPTEATPTEAAAEAAAEAALTATPVEEEAAAVVTPAPGFALVIAEGARLRVRAEPTTESAIVGWLQPGETVPVEERSADGLWVKVSGIPDTENLTGGWVLAEFVVLGQ